MRRVMGRMALASIGPAAADRDSELEDLRERAESIIERRQELELSAKDARREVQLLLKDLTEWGDTHGVELETRTRTYGAASERPSDSEYMTADRCPLFFEEELHDLCPLDLAKSEVWGGTILYCRYLCE